MKEEREKESEDQPGIEMRSRRMQLESMTRMNKSLIGIDGLLDSINALVLDCEPMKKNKNIENFLSRCN